MRHLIRHTIGAGLENDPDEIRLVRGTLKAINNEEFVPENLSGFIDDDLDTDIRNFQQSAGLVEDGKLMPGGETERNLISRITGENIDFATADETVLNRSVGDGGENDPVDVATLKRALGTVGRLKYDRTKPPPPFIDGKTVDALKGLQNDHNLLIDGRAEPDGETLKELRELLEENASAKPAEERQVALLPALLPLLFTLARTAPHVARQLVALRATYEAAKKLSENDQKRRSEGNSDSEFRGARTNGTTLPHIPPDPKKLDSGKTEFPPEDPDKNDGKIEGRSTDPIRNDPMIFPLPKNPKNLIQIFPGNTAKPDVPIIIERKGKEPVRIFNAQIARLLEKLGKEYGVIHVGGSRDADGNEIPETHLKNKDTGGLRGGSFPDITFEIPGLKTLIRFYVNSADRLRDGITLTTREREAAERLQYNMEDNAVLLTIPKPGPNETIDIDALGEWLEAILNDLKKLADGEIDKETFETWIKTTERLPLK